MKQSGSRLGKAHKRNHEVTTLHYKQFVIHSQTPKGCSTVKPLGKIILGKVPSLGNHHPLSVSKSCTGLLCHHLVDHVVAYATRPSLHLDGTRHQVVYMLTQVTCGAPSMKEDWVQGYILAFFAIWMQVR